MEQTHMKKIILLFTLLLASCFHHGEQNPPYVFKHEVLFVDNNNNLHSNLYVGLFDKGHQNPIANDNLYVEFYINVEGDCFNDTYITIQNASHKNENSYVLMTLFDFSEKKYGYSRAENSNVIYELPVQIVCIRTEKIPVYCDHMAVRSDIQRGRKIKALQPPWSCLIRIDRNKPQIMSPYSAIFIGI